jgi:hypothetical protein
MSEVSDAYLMLFGFLQSVTDPYARAALFKELDNLYFYAKKGYGTVPTVMSTVRAGERSGDTLGKESVRKR